MRKHVGGRHRESSISEACREQHFTFRFKGSEPWRRLLGYLGGTRLKVGSVSDSERRNRTSLKSEKRKKFMNS
jgi:hypothetical protein